MSHAPCAVLLVTGMACALAACYSTTQPPEPARTTLVGRVYERCDLNGEHCVRITCDRDADRCWHESQYASSDYYRHSGRWVCNADGDVCRYEYAK